MNSAAQPLGLLAQGLATGLRGWPRRRVTLSELWRLLDQTDPGSRASAARRTLLADALNELAAAGKVSLPASRSWDRSERPHLPQFVGLSPSESPATHTKAIVWHPVLSWADDERLSPTQRRHLDQMNTWLHQHRDTTIVPMRERSLEIFGHEKVLDQLTLTSAFTSGKLTLELLRCRRVAPRFTTEVVGGGDLLLVVENSDTFDSLLTSLTTKASHRVGLIGWGAGTAFEASVLSIRLLSRTVREVAYFGDLDEKGLQAPRNAAALAAHHGLPVIRPAEGLYQALLQQAQPQAGQKRLPQGPAVALCSWLHPSHREVAAGYLTAGERLAQEAVGLSYLMQHDEWARDLA